MIEFKILHRLIRHMIVEIPNVLSHTQLSAVRPVLDQARFVDGKASAGRHARRGKRNLELASDENCIDALNNVVMTQLVQHPLYLQCAMPAKICAPIYARYSAGMGYAGHIDDPVMGPAQSRYRSDISITVFLNPPEEYEGGELCIESTQGIREIKLSAGDAVLYPSTHYHSVREVSSGNRLVAVTWVQSHIRRADQREILVQLDRVRQQLGKDPEHPAYQSLNLGYTNLYRMWAEL